MVIPEGVFAFVVEDLEGGSTVTDHADDPGGLTRWGISQRAHPSLDIANLTREQAMEIYARDYWLRCRCDEMQLGVALVVFDCAVNMGTGTAAKLLQRAVGVNPDGVLGPTTMAAVKAADAKHLIEAILLARADKYFAINNPTFIRGWTNRLLRVAVKATGLAA